MPVRDSWKLLDSALSCLPLRPPSSTLVPTPAALTTLLLQSVLRYYFKNSLENLKHLFFPVNSAISLSSFPPNIPQTNRQNRTKKANN